ncbi:MAG: hypothetical protein WEG56_02915 [Chloroflexota bacterium]
MKKLIRSVGGASLAVLVLVGAVAAAGPRSGPAGDQVRDRDAIPAILGLTEAQVMELRQDGLSLAQIAERQSIDPQKLVDALKAQWTERIEARVTNGALTADRATELRSQVELQARNMVYKTTIGGLHGAAVGAGRGAGATDGVGSGFGGGRMAAGAGARGTGAGICDGSGRP